MNLLSEVFGFEARYSVENPTTPLSAANIARDFGGSASATSGVVVTKETVLGYPAVWRGVNLIAGYVAKIGFPVYKRTQGEDGIESGKERDKRHPAYRLTVRQPNDDMTAFIFKQVMQSHALMHGNGYAAIMRDGRGDPVELLLLNPTLTFPMRKDGILSYVTYLNGKWEGIVQRDVFHLKGLSSDGIMGYSVVDKLRDAIGIGMAAQEYASRYFKNNARPSYAIKLPGALRDETAVSRFRENINNIHSGPANSLRPMLLEQGAELVTLGFNNQDSQFLQTREFEVRQIANILGLPPHKLGDSSRTSYNSLEQENQSFLDDTLDFWFCGWEAEANCKLLREKEKQNDTHFFEFYRQSLVRANLVARTNSYHSALQDGWMSRDEVRARENLNPIPDGKGKDFLQPLNMGNAGGNPDGAVVVADDDEEIPPDDQTANRSIESQKEMLSHEVKRMLKRVLIAARKAAKKPDKFLSFVDGMEADHVRVVIEAVSPAVSSICAVRGIDNSPKYAQGVGEKFFAAVRDSLLRAADSQPEQLSGSVESAMAALESTLPSSISESMGAE